MTCKKSEVPWIYFWKPSMVFAKMPHDEIPWIKEANLSPHKFRLPITVKWFAEQVYSELHQFQNIISDVEIDRVIDIGTGGGGTALLWAMMVFPEGRVFTIDKNNLDSVSLQYRGTKYEKCIVEIWKDSHDPGTESYLSTLLEGREVDLLFIDGDHLLQGTEQDFNMYSKFVRDGGIIAFHDIADTITPVWERVRGTYRNWEILHVKDRINNGIGVLQWRKKLY